MKTPDDVKTRARTNYDRNVRAWLGGDFTPLTVSLSPPTIRRAEADNGEAVGEWLREWAHWTGPGEVEHVTKRLGYLGTYDVPTRIVFHSPEEIARAAGRHADWRLASTRLTQLTAALGEEVRAPLLTQLFRWRAWDEVTAERFIAVVRWLRTHDVSQYYIRQIPVIGVDTKWIEQHRPVVEAVVGQLPFRTKPPLVELRSLDPEVKIRNARRLCLEIDDAAGANPAFEQVLIVENHTTFLALPEIPGTFAVWGEGYRADELVAALPWLAQRRVFYWGDLDSHGFRILDRIRGPLPGVRSVLMDSETARLHLELAVEEPTATAFAPTRLTGDEDRALELLRERSGTGCLRIEQERIVFDRVVEQLTAAMQ